MPVQPAKQENIRNLDAQITELERRLHDLRLERNRFTALGSLPPEVVVMICEYLHDPTQPQILSFFMQVCSHVYYAAISAAHLWTTLHWLQNTRWRELCVVRSRGLPLRVYWKKQALNGNSQAHDKDWIYDVFTAASSATIDIPPRLLSNRPLDFLHAPAPLMRILRISSLQVFMPIDRSLLGGQLQNLKILELNNVELFLKRRDFPGTWECPAMRHLTLVGCRAELEDLRFMACAMSNLEVLAIRRPYIVKPNIETSAIAGTGSLSPITLPRLHTLQLEQIPVGRHVGSLLSILPNPSKHFTITMEVPTDDWLDVASNSIVLFRLAAFWECATGSRVLPHLKAVVSTPRINIDEGGIYPMLCILTAGVPEDESIILNSGIPSLALSTMSEFDGDDAMLLSSVTTLEFALSSYSVELEDFRLPDLFTHVQHVTITGAVRDGTTIADLHNHEEELFAWVRARATAGRPIQTIKFKDAVEPLPEFTQRFVHAGGGNLRIFWKEHASQ
jgi:hypothetical protein